jgi:SNF2 family DNA or RNA helicase
VVARSLAPYQRSGAHFILERIGRALLADEMGLGKTVQAIADMSAYAATDWPLLVLCFQVQHSIIGKLSFDIGWEQGQWHG